MITTMLVINKTKISAVITFYFCAVRLSHFVTPLKAGRLKEGKRGEGVEGKDGWGMG